MHRTARTTALVAAAAFGLVGCTPDAPVPTVSPTVAPEPSEVPGADPDETASPTASPGTGAGEGPLPDEDPAGEEAEFPGDAQPDTGEASDGARLSPTDLRFGVHEGFDRIVVDLSGEGEPGWQVEYTEAPTQQGSGEAVDLAGGAYLTVTIEGVTYPTEEGAQEYGGPETLTPESGGIVEEIVWGPLFEGQQQVFVGLLEQQPFRVFALEDPARVVIDVEHP